ncbi:hypothetical protein ANN_25400 [Periplaneta americana]|uniref:Uncharacterized protein n=1 Tax=Periplaneta americana TaxID=6978 RepID=A0ABQ8S1D0_PERAM|nr:hypothetical protein ANN_25400 [Periplaneta americana]
MTQNLKSNLRGTDICPVAFSDHCGYIITLRIPRLPTPFGRGIWKLNTSILKEEDFKEDLEHKWRIYQRQKSRYPNILEWWVNTKQKLGKWMKYYSILRQQEIKGQEEYLYGLLRDIYASSSTEPRLTTLLKKVKASILKIQHDRDRGTQIRARSNSMSGSQLPCMMSFERRRGGKENILT